MQCVWLVTLTAAAAVAECASNSAGAKPVSDSAFASPHFKAWDSKASSLMSANEESLCFSSNVSAAYQLRSIWHIWPIRALNHIAVEQKGCVLMEELGLI